MTKALKYRVRGDRDLLGYVYARSEQEAWTKARLKYGALVAKVQQL